MNDAPPTFYRRCLLDGRRHVFHSFGPGRVLRDDAAALVIDFAYEEQTRMSSFLGWELDSPRSRLFDTNAIRAYARLFAFRNRWLNITQSYDPAGRLIVSRVDCATPAQDVAHGVYQTDLYLDCFVGPDDASFLVEDQEEVEEAEQLGLLTLAQRGSIETEMAGVVDLLQRGQWRAWLQQIAGSPFDRSPLTVPRRYAGFTLEPNDPRWPKDVA